MTEPIYPRTYCSRCKSLIAPIQPLFRPTSATTLCKHCVGWTRHARTKFTQSSCGACHRELRVVAGSDVRYCSPACCARAFGVGGDAQP